MAKTFFKTIIMIIISMVMACTALFAAAATDVGGENDSFISADQPDLFACISGELLTEEEMQTVTGNLWIKGWQLKKRQQRQSYKQTCSDTSKVHCDILAQNKLDDMGYETANQDGSNFDYDQTKVVQIFTEGFPDNRYEEPPVGAGYIFSTRNEEKEHMQVYIHSPGADTYTRLTNDGKNNLPPETHELNSKPNKVKKQCFVSLKKMEYFKR